MRLFCIWNRGYKPLHVVAETIEEALALSKAKGHTVKGHRKWRDCTDSEIDGSSPELVQAALDSGMTGVAVLEAGRGWLIEGEPTWPDA